MIADFLAALTFILVTTFTPGPNNVSCAAMGALHGYRRSLPYLLGVGCGVFSVMLVVALLSASLLRVVPQLAVVLRYVGAAYILYLAYSILKASYTVKAEDARPLTFINGLLLQLLNPKLLVFSLTLFTSLLTTSAYSLPELVLAALLLGLMSFASGMLWAAGGTLISRVLHSRRAEQAVNIVLALFLVYTALDLLDIL
jgi:cysteine/O-acetylserine efflux protein